MTCNEVMREFLSIEGSLFQRLAMADEIVRLRVERDALQGYYEDAVKVGTECAEKMRRAERILAALREPSEAVIEAMREHIYADGSTNNDVSDGIRAAVAAAEQEGGA